MLQILSLFFGITARRKICLWKFKELVKRSWYKNSHPAWCTTDSMQFLLVPVQFWVILKRSTELFVFPSTCTSAAKIHFQADTLTQPLLQSAVICLQIARIKIWSRAWGNNILQHDSLGQIPHAQLPLRSKYGQHLFPDWAQNVSPLLLK